MPEDDQPDRHRVAHEDVEGGVLAAEVLDRDLVVGGRCPARRCPVRSCRARGRCSTGPAWCSKAVLLVSSPSGMVLSGSTAAWLMTVMLAMGRPNHDGDHSDVRDRGDQAGRPIHGACDAADDVAAFERAQELARRRAGRRIRGGHECRPCRHGVANGHSERRLGAEVRDGRGVGDQPVRGDMGRDPIGLGDGQVDVLGRRARLRP